MRYEAMIIWKYIDFPSIYWMKTINSQYWPIDCPYQSPIRCQFHHLWKSFVWYISLLSNIWPFWVWVVVVMAIIYTLHPYPFQTYINRLWNVRDFFFEKMSFRINVHEKWSLVVWSFGKMFSIIKISCL